MATVIDSLLIQLGFDTSGIERGQKRADEATESVRKHSERTGKSLDQMGREGRNAFRGMAREALTFFAVLTAGRSLKAFIQDNTESNVALQNMARNIGTTTRALGAWGNVAREFGGTASDVSSSMQSLVSQFQTVSGRQNLGVIFGQMGVRLQDAHGHLRSMGDLIPDLAKAAQRLGPQLFSALGKQAGFSQGFINMLEHGPTQLENLYKALQKYAPSKADVDASQHLLRNWILLTAQSESFGRSIMTSLTPELDDLMGQFSTWIDKNHALIKQDIDQYVRKIAKAVEGVDWHKVEQDIAGVAHGVGDVVHFLGGWQRATEAIFALWVGSKFIKLLANIVAIGRAAGVTAKALGGLIAAGADSALLAGTTLGATAVALSSDTATNPAAHKWAPGWGTQQWRGAFGGNLSPYHNLHVGSGDQASKAAAIRGYLMKTYGLTKGEADGIVANLAAEDSSFDPSKVGDNGAAYGIGQWHKARQEEFRKLYGHSIQSASLAEQLDFLMAEIHGHTGDSRAAKVGAMLANPKLRKQSEAKQARLTAYATSLYDERPAGGKATAKKRANSTTGLIAAMDRAQSSTTSSTTIHHHATTINAPITIDGSHSNAAEIAHNVKNRIIDLHTYARQTNSGVQ